MNEDDQLANALTITTEIESEKGISASTEENSDCTTSGASSWTTRLRERLTKRLTELLMTKRLRKSEKPGSDGSQNSKEKEEEYDGDCEMFDSRTENLSLSERLARNNKNNNKDVGNDCDSCSEEGGRVENVYLTSSASKRKRKRGSSLLTKLRNKNSKSEESIVENVATPAVIAIMEDNLQNSKLNTKHFTKFKDDGQYQYQCNICLKRFKSRSNKVKHIQCKKNEKLFQCQYCKTNKLRKTIYEKHLLHHTGMVHYVCHLCGEWFVQKKKYVLHCRLHSGTSHFFCKLCDKRFLYHRFQTHMKTHVGETSFECRHCHQQFVEKIIQQNHKKSPSPIPKEEGGRELRGEARCTSCGKKFRTKYNLLTHLLTQIKCQFACDICTKEFSKVKRPFECFCKKKFSTRNFLESHQETEHKDKKGEETVTDPATAATTEQQETAPEATVDTEKEDEVNCNDNLKIGGSEEEEESVQVKESVAASTEVVGSLIKEPCEHLSLFRIQVGAESAVYEFQRITPVSKDKWQQTNPNYQQGIDDDEFCSHCQIWLGELDFRGVNILCGHSKCKNCFSDTDDENCLHSNCLIKCPTDDLYLHLTEMERLDLSRALDSIKENLRGECALCLSQESHAQKSISETGDAAEDVPKCTEDVPKCTEDATKCTEDATKCTEDATKCTEDAATNARNDERCAEDANEQCAEDNTNGRKVTNWPILLPFVAKLSDDDGKEKTSEKSVQFP